MGRDGEPLPSLIVSHTLSFRPRHGGNAGADELTIGRSETSGEIIGDPPIYSQGHRLPYTHLAISRKTDRRTRSPGPIQGQVPSSSRPHPQPSWLGPTFPGTPVSRKTQADSQGCWVPSAHLGISSRPHPRPRSPGPIRGEIADLGDRESSSTPPHGGLGGRVLYGGFQGLDCVVTADATNTLLATHPCPSPSRHRSQSYQGISVVYHWCPKVSTHPGSYETPVVPRDLRVVYPSTAHVAHTFLGVALWALCGVLF